LEIEVSQCEIASRFGINAKTVKSWEHHRGAPAKKNLASNAQISWMLIFGFRKKYQA
jgi:hypothetical protein